MKKFDIEYEGKLTIEATDIDEARNVFKEKYRHLGWECGYLQINKGIVEGYAEVVGHCEATGLAIFEGDEYVVDHPEGIMILKSNK